MFVYAACYSYSSVILIHFFFKKKKSVLVLRSAMIADYMFWLGGGGDQCVSKLIRLYWQVKIDAPPKKGEPISF